MRIAIRTVITSFLFLLSVSVVTQGAVSADVSERLRIPDEQTLLLTAKGVGVQIYKSQLKSGSTTEFEWVLKEPQANLYDNAREKIGTHYAGPTWESKDGSKVVGKLKQSVPAPNAGNIPWLLVEAQSHGGKEGIFSTVSYILRVDTVGGVAPGYPPTAERQEKQVPYKATYIFLAAAPCPAGQQCCGGNADPNNCTGQCKDVCGVQCPAGQPRCCGGNENPANCTGQCKLDCGVPGNE
jgi:uncharacterized protein DUF3455